MGIRWLADSEPEESVVYIAQQIRNEKDASTTEYEHKPS